MSERVWSRIDVADEGRECGYATLHDLGEDSSAVALHRFATARCDKPTGGLTVELPVGDTGLVRAPLCDHHAKVVLAAYGQQ
jgi:hypothetical protein